MNDLYLIGNGFDLAHGLKTSYTDFLLWYLKRSLNVFVETDQYEDSLIKITRTEYRYRIEGDFKSISELLDYLRGFKYSIIPHHVFFQKIVKNYRDYKWVDIEYEYYMALVELYKGLEKAGGSRLEQIDKELQSLNNCFNLIKEKLTEYLQTIKINSEHENLQIESILFEKTGVEDNNQGEKLFVNFNYTKTLGFYSIRNSFKKNNLINIHGELDNLSNPIIFGYGDEIDPHYEKIENLNINDFLKNIKSFGYLMTDNYQRVLRFIDKKFSSFTVKILGHSCGLSDWILLNTIFEHPNCKYIKIYYYQKSQTENDYFEKTQEISRHFKASGKGDMRKKIVPFNQSTPMPQNPKDD